MIRPMRVAQKLILPFSQNARDRHNMYVAMYILFNFVWRRHSPSQDGIYEEYSSIFMFTYL